MGRQLTPAGVHCFKVRSRPFAPWAGALLDRAARFVNGEDAIARGDRRHRGRCEFSIKQANLLELD